jgi:hypothetical protein
MHTILNGKNDNWNYIGKWWLKKYDQIYNAEYFHFGIICLVKPKMNSPLKFLRKMLKLIFLELLIMILCKLTTLTVLHVFLIYQLITLLRFLAFMGYII